MKNSANVSTVNNALLAKINAIGITENLKEKNSGKSIFKKEFNNKTDRTACRTKFINAVQMFLLQTAHNKLESAQAQMKIASDVADKYYLAGATFKNVSDYASNNMEENKKESIKLFLELCATLDAPIKEKKVRVKKDKIVVAPVLDAVEQIEK